jgi:hypothetical protein
MFNSESRAALLFLLELSECMKLLATNIVILETSLNRSIRSGHRSNIDPMFHALAEEFVTFDSLSTPGLETSYTE